MQITLLSSNHLVWEKSRMLLEASHKVFAVIMNFRNNEMTGTWVGMQVPIPQTD
jgi:hypothetical protein